MDSSKMLGISSPFVEHTAKVRAFLMGRSTKAGGSKAGPSVGAGDWSDGLPADWQSQSLRLGDGMEPTTPFIAFFVGRTSSLRLANAATIRSGRGDGRWG